MSDLDTMVQIAAAADAGANEIDAAARGPDLDENGQPVPEPQVVGYGQEAAQIVDLFAALVVGYAPKAGQVWNDGAKSRTAAALAPVLEKYGFTLGGMPPELTFAIIAGPLLWQSSKIVAEQVNEERRAALPAQQEPARVASKEAAPAPAPAAPRGATNPAGPEVLEHPQVALYRT